MFFLCIISLFFWLPLAVQVRISRTQIISNFGNYILTWFAHNQFSSGQFHLSKSYLTSQVLLYAVIARLVFHRILIQKLNWWWWKSWSFSCQDTNLSAQISKSNRHFTASWPLGGAWPSTQVRSLSVDDHQMYQQSHRFDITFKGRPSNTILRYNLSLLMIIRCVNAIASSTTNTNSATALLPLSTSSWPTQSPSKRRCCQSCPGWRDVSENTSQMAL